MTAPHDGPIGPIDHVAVLVRSIDAVLPRYAELFGLRPSGPIRLLEAQRVRVVFLPTGPAPAPRIELIEPIDAESGVARYLASRGEGLHHVCFRTEAIGSEVECLAGLGAELIDARPREGAEGLVAFVHPRTLSGVLWELLEPSRD
jgi:methylmalonyl-CoA/ethylmalonyl-CoA epimerase